MKRFSQEMLYFAMVTFAEVGAEWVALFNSRYALSSVLGRLV